MATIDRSSRQTGSAGWRETRPFWGGLLLILGSFLIGWVAWRPAMELSLIGGPFTMVGLVFAVIVFLLGAFALIRPDLSTIIGATGVAFSILSLIGSLGGLLFGTILGIAGGALCIAWKPPGRGERRERATETSSVGSTGQSEWEQSMGSVTAETEQTSPTTDTGSWEGTQTETKTFEWQEDPSTSASTGTQNWEEETTTETTETSPVGSDDVSEEESWDEDTGEESWDDGSDDDPTFSWQKDPYGERTDDT